MTIAVYKALKKAFPEKPDEVLADVTQAFEQDLASKQDISELRALLKQDFAEMKSDLLSKLLMAQLAIGGLIVALIKFTP